MNISHEPIRDAHTVTVQCRKFESADTADMLKELRGLSKKAFRQFIGFWTAAVDMGLDIDENVMELVEDLESVERLKVSYRDLKVITRSNYADIHDIHYNYDIVNVAFIELDLSPDSEDNVDAEDAVDFDDFQAKLKTAVKDVAEAFGFKKSDNAAEFEAMYKNVQKIVNRFDSTPETEPLVLMVADIANDMSTTSKKHGNKIHIADYVVRWVRPSQAEYALSWGDKKMHQNAVAAEKWG
jgi:hypothetical protein